MLHFCRNWRLALGAVLLPWQRYAVALCTAASWRYVYALHSLGSNILARPKPLNTVLQELREYRG
jgi:hypothetical protein